MSRRIFRNLLLGLPFVMLPSCAQVERALVSGLSDHTPPDPTASSSAANHWATRRSGAEESSAAASSSAVTRNTVAAAAGNELSADRSAGASAAAESPEGLTAGAAQEARAARPAAQTRTDSSNSAVNWAVAAAASLPDLPVALPQASTPVAYEESPAPPAADADGTQRPGQPLRLPAVDETEGSLSLAEIEDIALTYNPTLAQASAAITGAEGRYIQGGLYPNPQVGYQASEVGNDGKGGQQGAYISQTFVTAGKLELNQHTAAHEIEARQQDFEAQRQRVLTSVRIGFYDVLNAQRTVAISEQLVRISEEGVKTAQALFDAQQAGRVDLLQARIELNSARVLLRNAKNRQTAAWQQLAAVLGQPDRPMERVGGSLEPDAQELVFDAVLDRILAASPEIQAAHAEVQRARVALQRAEVQPIPNLQTQTGLQYDYGSQFAIAGVQIGVNLPVFNRNEGNIQVAYAQMLAAQREVERLRLDLKNRLATVMEAYQNATFQVERYTNEILPDAKDSLELITSGYTQGEFDYNRLLLAQRTYFQNNIAYLAALRQWWTAKLQIDGLLLTGGLDRAG